MRLVILFKQSECEFIVDGQVLRPPCGPGLHLDKPPCQLVTIQSFRCTVRGNQERVPALLVHGMGRTCGLIGEPRKAPQGCCRFGIQPIIKSLVGRGQFDAETAGRDAGSATWATKSRRIALYLSIPSSPTFRGTIIGNLVAIRLLPQHQSRFIDVVECRSYKHDHIVVAHVLLEVFFPLSVVTPRATHLREDATAHCGCCLALR